LWGDTHLHTNLSPDAQVNKNTTVTPHDACLFARGMAVISEDSRAKVRLETSLDFLAV
jgi:Fe-S oxidoreductase